MSLTQTKTGRAWAAMRSRCNNKNVKNYGNYGGRGIRCCERWASFANFLADMGECPPGLSLDRINNDGNYEPGNCRWTDWLTQANNRREKRCERKIVVSGEAIDIREASRKYGISYKTIWVRLKHGWTEEDAALLPLYSKVPYVQGESGTQR